MRITSRDITNAAKEDRFGCVWLQMPSELSRKFAIDYLSKLSGCLAGEICLHILSTGETEQSPGVCAQPSLGFISIKTSGTTGVPKEVRVNLRNQIRIPANSSTLSRCWLVSFALDKWAGVAVCSHALLAREAISIPTSLAKSAVLTCIADDGVTNLNTTPSMFRKLTIGSPNLQNFGEAISHVTLGGESIPESILTLVKKSLPLARVTHVYASTEFGELFASSDGKEGYPLARVLSNDRLQLNEEGELLVDGNGTGDFFRVGDDRIFYTGRAGTFINVGGQKVPPEEVKNFALSIDGVFLARVSSEKNALLGEIVVLEYEGQIVEEEVRRQMRASLPKYMVPLKIRKVQEVKLSAAGKS